jgi:hypothetical protein
MAEWGSLDVSRIDGDGLTTATRNRSVTERNVGICLIKVGRQTFYDDSIRVDEVSTVGLEDRFITHRCVADCNTSVTEGCWKPMKSNEERETKTG